MGLNSLAASCSTNKRQDEEEPQTNRRLGPVMAVTTAQAYSDRWSLK